MRSRDVPDPLHVDDFPGIALREQFVEERRHATSLLTNITPPALSLSAIAWNRIRFDTRCAFPLDKSSDRQTESGARAAEIAGGRIDRRRAGANVQYLCRDEFAMKIPPAQRSNDVATIVNRADAFIEKLPVAISVGGIENCRCRCRVRRASAAAPRSRRRCRNRRDRNCRRYNSRLVA